MSVFKNQIALYRKCSRFSFNFLFGATAP